MKHMQQNYEKQDRKIQIIYGFARQSSTQTETRYAQKQRGNGVKYDNQHRRPAEQYIGKS